MSKRKKKSGSPFLVAIMLTICIFVFYYYDDVSSFLGFDEEVVSYSIDSIPAYNGKAYVYIDNNVPDFSSFPSSSFQFYSNLDALGRSGYAYANIGKDLMPTEKRGKIGMIKPSGWHTVKYDIVDGKYLYNRCHLIG